MWALSDASPSSSSSSSDSGRLSARTKAVPPQQASALTIWVTHVGLWLSQAFRTIATKMFLRPRFSCHLQSGFEIGLCAFWLCWNLRRHPDETMTLLNSSQLPQFIRSPIMAARLTQRKSSLAVQRPDVPRRCAIISDLVPRFPSRLPRKVTTTSENARGTTMRAQSREAPATDTQIL